MRKIEENMSTLNKKTFFLALLTKVMLSQ